MSNVELQFKEKISRRSAHEMILLFAKYGNHYLDINKNIVFKSDADVKRFLASQGIDYEKFVQHCRLFSNTVPIFENLAPSTMDVPTGIIGARVDGFGNEDLITEGPGKIVLYGYWATFESAIKARDRVLENKEIKDYHTMFVEGIASIEGYINHRAEVWNKNNPTNPLIDTRDKKVNLEDKIDGWIPIMLQGKKIDKSMVSWQHFKIIRSIRNNFAIHPKQSGIGISYSKLAEGINYFRAGIAQILIQLHQLFEDKIPSIIIRAANAPEVEVINKHQN